MNAFDYTRFAPRRNKSNYVTKSGKTYVEREGRLIEIETVETKADAKAKAARAKRDQQHVGCPWGYLVDVCRLTPGRSTAFIVIAILIYRRTVVCRGRTVTLPNTDLAELGIDRPHKSRVLAALADVGLIRIEQTEPGQTSKVTLLWAG
jgi:hypothetical protein